jgi:drug/metabolite transporter (DMT)-like permease
MHRVMRTSCLALALTLAGCSIIGTRSVAEHGAERCTTSVFPAAADTLTVAGAIAFATYASLQMEDVDHIAIPVATGVVVIWGISAIVGYSRATTCKRARIREGLAY